MMESQSMTTERPGKNAAIMLVIVVVLSAAFTAWCVDASFTRGSLSSVPNYDDVTYFLSATKILEAFHHSGFDGIVKLLQEHRDILHSPYSTMLAAAAFAVLGYHDSSPYIFNFFVILFYLLFLWQTLRDLPLAMRSAIMVCFLALPFATMAVVEFRPDLCWATLVGFCAIFGISSRTYFTDWRQPAIHAVLFAVSLLVKPTTFPMTIFVFGYSVCFQLAMEWHDRKALPWRNILKLMPIYVFVTFVIAGPYIIFFGSETWTYFREDVFGVNKGLWVYQGDLLHHLGYYLASGAAKSNLGYPGLIIGCFFLAGTYDAVARRDAAGIRLAGGLWGIVAAVYLINTLPNLKSAFLGGAFYATLIFSAACLWNNAVTEFLRRHPQSKHLLTAGAIVLMSLSIMLYQWPKHSGRWTSVEGRNFNYVGKSVMNEIARLPLPQNPMIVFTQTGPIIFENVEIWFLQRGQAVNIINLSFNDNISAFNKILGEADLILVQDPNSMGAFLRLPSESLQEQFRQILSTDPRFTLVKKLEALDGKNIYIYFKNPQRLQ